MSIVCLLMKLIIFSLLSFYRRNDQGESTISLIYLRHMKECSKNRKVSLIVVMAVAGLFQTRLILVLLNSDFSVFENTVDPDQLAKKDRWQRSGNNSIKYHT